MSESSDPWKSLSPPAQTTSVSGRRVDPKLQWGLYWAVDADKSCLLILQHAPEKRPRNKLPNLRGLEIETRVPQTGHNALLVIRLKDEEQREIFHSLCLDIVASTRLAKTEEEAIERFLARTWRWHRLLRGDRDIRLSEDEQKGLIAELQLMQKHLFPSLGVQAALKSWTGPFDAPKDFEVGRVCIEVKARRGAATPYVAISTEHQLDTDGLDALFLNVSEITSTSQEDPKGLTVTDVSRELFEEIQEKDESAIELFDERLLAVGFDWADDYSDKRWLMGPVHLFEVVDDFPRIIPDMYNRGVANVRYAISLQECEAFRTDHAKLASLLEGGVNGGNNR